MLDILKIINILYVLAFYKLSKKEKYFAYSLQKLGPTFIKLGQFLSTRADLVGEKLAAELAYLQDNLPPFSAEIAQATIKKELGKDVAELFAAFEPEPIAAASIAQVHKARTRDGKEIAVKILRPKIEKRVKQDLRLFFRIARFIARFVPSAKRIRPVQVIETLAASLRLELDLCFEAASASELKENTADDSGIYIPKVYWDYTSRRVLVTEWIDAVPVSNMAKLKKGSIPLKKAAENLVINFFNQAYRDGFFHADLHPGNILIKQNGDIALIDFGIMGRLDQKTRIYVAEILRGFLKHDYMYVAEIHFAAGYVPANQSKQQFANACRSIGEPIVGKQQSQVSVVKLLTQLLKITADFDMPVQPQLLLLQKTTVTVESMSNRLYSGINLWKLAEPWIQEWAKDNISKKAKMKRKLKQFAGAVAQLPELIARFDKILQAIEEGEFCNPKKSKEKMD